MLKQIQRVRTRITSDCLGFRFSIPQGTLQVSDDDLGTLFANLATVIAARYAAAIAGWNGEITPEFKKTIRVLHCLSHDVSQLRRGDHRRARLELDHEREESASAEHELLELLNQIEAPTPSASSRSANDKNSPELP